MSITPQASENCSTNGEASRASRKRAWEYLKGIGLYLKGDRGRVATASPEDDDC